MFCGEADAPSAGEDVFPVWLGNKLAYSSGLLREGEAEARYLQSTYDNLSDFQKDMAELSPGDRAVHTKHVGATPSGPKLPDVCVTCNGGWMARLEDAVKLVIGGIMFRRQKAVDPFDQYVLATWTIKTCLTHDASLPERLIPEEYGSRRFFALGRPLPMSQVGIGYDADLVPDGTLVHGRQPLELSLPGTDLQAARFAFQFNHLILQAVINYGENVSESGVGIVVALDPPQFEPVWPVRDRFVWPSEEILGTAVTDEEPPPEATT
jgi:hypothetical protein